MSAIGTLYDEHLMDATLGVNRLAAYPAAVFAALWTVAPGRDGTGGTEVANAGSYARVNINPASNTTWPAAAANLKSNGALITFPTATGAWGTVVAVTFMSSGTYGAGSLFMLLPLASSRAIASGTTARFVVGGVRMTVP